MLGFKVGFFFGGGGWGRTRVRGVYNYLFSTWIINEEFKPYKTAFLDWNQKQTILMFKKKGPFLKPNSSRLGTFQSRVYFYLVLVNSVSRPTLLNACDLHFT